MYMHIQLSTYIHKYIHIGDEHILLFFSPIFLTVIQPITPNILLEVAIFCQSLVIYKASYLTVIPYT